MTKQNEHFRAVEKGFFKDQCRRLEVREALTGGGNNCVDAANLMWPEYKAKYSGPFGEEPEQEWIARWANAPGNRRAELFRKPAEDAAAAAARMKDQLMVYFLMSLRPSHLTIAP